MFPIQPLMLFATRSFDCRCSSTSDEAGRFSTSKSRSERPRVPRIQSSTSLPAPSEYLLALSSSSETVVSRLHLVGPALFLPTLKLRRPHASAVRLPARRSVAFFFRSSDSSSRTVAVEREHLSARRAALHSSSVLRMLVAYRRKLIPQGFLRSSALACCRLNLIGRSFQRQQYQRFTETSS